MTDGRRWGAVVVVVFAALGLAPVSHAAPLVVLARGEPLEIAVPVD